MKKVLFILSITALLFAACDVAAQTKPTEPTVDGTINKPAWSYWLGSTSDTLTNASADTVDIKFVSNTVQDFNISMYADHVSGTGTYNMKTYKSMDGSQFEVTAAGDSLQVGSITGDGMQAGRITLDNFNSKVLRIILTQSGTAVSVPKIYTLNRNN